MIKRKGGKRAVRRIFLLIAFCVFINNMLACTFDKNQAKLTANAIDKSSFSVTYINVGMGDATFINFGNGKNMLIDVGSDTDFAYNNLTNTLDYFGVDKIDYLVLTHPDSEHIGNAKKILNNYLVDKLYLSNVSDEVFLDLKEIKSLATFKNVNTIYSDYKTHFNINGAKVYFLYPSPKTLRDSVYREGFSSVSTSYQIDKLSTVIYLNYKDIKFLFSSDMTSDTEQKIIDLLDSETFNTIFNQTISLTEIDFYKVASHGSGYSNTKNFLTKIKPENAIISVGGNNSYGYPDISVIERLTEVNDNARFFRTDVYGNIKVTVNINGGVKIETNMK